MPARRLKEAEEAIQHFEKAGRVVVSVAILKDGVRVEFADKVQEITSPADLIVMGEK